MVDLASKDIKQKYLITEQQNNCIAALIVLLDAQDFLIQQQSRVIVGPAWHIGQRVQHLLRVALERAHEYCTADVNRSHQTVTLTDVSAYNLLVVVEYADHRIVLVARLLQVPHFDALVHGARDELCLMEHDGCYEVVVRLELVDARACLEAEYVDVVVLASQCEALLA